MAKNVQTEPRHTLDKDVEYIVVQNEITGAILAKITDSEVENKFPIIVRVKYT